MTTPIRRLLQQHRLPNVTRVSDPRMTLNSPHGSGDHKHEESGQAETEPLHAGVLTPHRFLHDTQPQVVVTHALRGVVLPMQTNTVKAVFITLPFTYKFL